METDQTQNTNHSKPKRVWRLRKVMDETGLSKSSVYRLSGDEDSDFPRKVRLSAAAVGWFEGEMLAWLDSRKAVA